MLLFCSAPNPTRFSLCLSNIPWFEPDQGVQDGIAESCCRDHSESLFCGSAMEEVIIAVDRRDSRHPPSDLHSIIVENHLEALRRFGLFGEGRI